MSPVCLFNIIVLAFIALWLIGEGTNKAPHPTEYYPSGGTAYSPSVREAARNAGPLPLHASDLLYPPYNPVANDRVVWGDGGQE